MIAPDWISTSPFFNDAPPAAFGVIIHATRGGRSLNPSELEGTLNWFINPVAEVSSHWVVGRQGHKVRVISDNRQAWHAGEHNETHWGIELEQGVESDGFTPEQIAACIDICRGYVQDFGVPPVHAFNGFVGHQETPQGMRRGKSDPGALFPWAEFIDALVTPTSATSASGVSIVQPTLQQVGDAYARTWLIASSGTGNLADALELDKNALRWIVARF